MRNFGDNKLIGMHCIYIVTFSNSISGYEHPRMKSGVAHKEHVWIAQIC